MRGLLAAAACAAAIALVAPNAVADEAMDHQIRQIASLTEIGQIAVIKMRRAAPESAGEPGAEPGGQSVEDLLLSGMGERRMLTAEDDDEFDPAVAEETPGQTMETAAAAEPGPTDPDNGPLVEAIQDNAVLADALAERNVELMQVVGVEVRDGTTVIVYLDETRG